ncbi:MAG: serine hydrolase domain-containing protein, partial [Phenylobacterium sp.]
ACLAALALLSALPRAADAPAPPPAESAAPAPAIALPKGPVPYTQLNPRRQAPRPKAGSSSSASSATTTSATATPTGPTVAGAAPTVAGLAVNAAGARLFAGQPLPPAELEAFVDGLVRDAMAREHIAGATVSIVQNGQVILKKGYGFASLNPRKPVDPDRTLFRIGSISKTFTWVALMKEVEAGRIRLNQPVNLYLPEKVQIRDQGYETPVRVANLMDHSAGFEDRALGQLFERNFDRVRPLDLYLRQERPKRVHAPGAVSSYSNYGAGLAGMAVAWSSGKPFERLIEEEILIPAGLTHTTFREPHPVKQGLPGPMPASLLGDVADGYRWTPTGFAKRDYEFIGQIAPAGAASSTAGDMARYMLLQLGGGQLGGVTVYGPRAAQAFRTPLRRTPAGINGWAHGFLVSEMPGGHTAYGHSGATLSFMSNLVVVPDLNLGIFISTNSETGGSLANRFPAAVVRQFYAAPQVFPRPGSPDLKSAAGAYRGYYVTTRRAYSGLEGFVMRLIGGAAVSVTPQGRLAVSGEEVRTFVPEGPVGDGRFIGAQDDNRLVFALRDGRARSFTGSGGAARFDRVGFWMRPTTLAALAALTAAASLATLGGVFLRNRREFRENQIQARAGLIQNIQAALWLVALVMFGLWASKTGDIAQIMYRWPGALLITASACALVAAALTVTTVVALPTIWRGGRRVDSWTHLRKAFFSVTVVIYAAFSLVLGFWGALSPWSG